ncbi:hypothetical protein R3P38DRAFT_2806659 [Favolaschia claudopus]|uniref:Uncharacterized protein n=1 Tax=Favolaschia claudopus TaxID=2862362 RepID=A0AAV9ZIR7_9AGAR
MATSDDLQFASLRARSNGVSTDCPPPQSRRAPGIGSVMSAAAPIASMAPSAAPAFVTDPYAPAQAGVAPPSGQSYAATGRVQIHQASIRSTALGKSHSRHPPQSLAGCTRGDRFLVNSLQPAGLPRNLISLRVRASAVRDVEPVGKMKAHTQLCRPVSVTRGHPISAVVPAPEAPSIAVSIAAVLRSACANSFEDITSILADTDDEEFSDSPSHTVTAPVSVPSFGFGIPTIVVVFAVTVQVHGMHDGNTGVKEKGGHGDTADEVVENEILDDDSAPTRRKTVETTPIEVQCRWSDDEDGEDEQVDGPTV